MVLALTTVCWRKSCLVLPKFTTQKSPSPWAPGALCRHSSAPALQSALHSAEQRSWDSLQICAGEAAVSERSQSDSSWLVLFFLSAFV